MAKYEKKFSPKKANPSAAALFDFLADGSAKSRSDVVTAIESTVPAPRIDASESEMKKHRRAVATNTIYVARRTGRLIEDKVNGTIALEPEIAEQWRQFRGDTAVTISTPVADDAITSVTVEPTVTAVETEPQPYFAAV